MTTIYLAANFITATEAGPLIPGNIENSGHLQFVYDGDGTLVESEVQSFFLGLGNVITHPPAF